MSKLDKIVAESYDSLHAKGAFSGRSWHDHLGTFTKHVPIEEDTKILDYGCGPHGGLAEVLGGQVIPFDPFVPAYAAKPWKLDFQVFFSCDVLEHLPEQGVVQLLDLLRQRPSLRNLFLVVSTRPAKKFLSNGLNAHLTIRTAEFWYGILSGGLGSSFEVQRAKSDLIEGDCVFVLARRDEQAQDS